MYIKIDWCDAYNLMHIQVCDKWKTTLGTCCGHFKYVVMHFGLTYAPIIFQHLMNDVFCELILMVCYINGIFIFSNNMEEHEQHLWLVLDKLQEVGLFATLKEYEFHQIKVEFISYTLEMVFTWTLIRFKPLWIKPPNFCLWYSMFSYICQLLAMFYCALFHESGPLTQAYSQLGYTKKLSNQKMIAKWLFWIFITFYHKVYS